MANGGDDGIVSTGSMVGRDDSEQFFADDRLADRPWRDGRFGHAGICRSDVGSAAGACSTVALLFASEPAYAAWLSWYFLGETLDVQGWIGSALILLAVMIGAFGG